MAQLGASPEAERSDAPAQTSRLLTLPGGIRNRIYTLLADAVIYGRLTMVSPSDHGLPAEEREWHKESRCALGLEQTCHQIRSEFRPIHQSWYTTRVSLQHAHWYLEDFFITGAQAPEKVEAKFALITPKSGTYHLDKLMKILNAYPNIQFMKRPAKGAVSVRLSARRRACIERQILEGLLYAKDKNPKWWSFYKEHVTELKMYFYHERIISLYINIKRATAEAWQLCGPTTKGEGLSKPVDNMGKIQEAMGLGYLGPKHWYQSKWYPQEGVELDGQLLSYRREEEENEEEENEEEENEQEDDDIQSTQRVLEALHVGESA